jgi:hypothetical protein
MIATEIRARTRPTNAQRAGILECAAMSRLPFAIGIRGSRALKKALGVVDLHAHAGAELSAPPDEMPPKEKTR